MSDHGMISPRTAIRQRVQRLLQAGLPMWDARITPERVCVNRAIPSFGRSFPDGDDDFSSKNYGQTFSCDISQTI